MSYLGRIASFWPSLTQEVGCCLSFETRLEKIEVVNCGPLMKQSVPKAMY